jgi:hypothetical protein
MSKKNLYADQALKLRKLRGARSVKEYAQLLRIKLRAYYRYETGERHMPDGLMLLAEKMETANGQSGQTGEKKLDYDLHGGWQPRSIEELAGVPEGMGMGRAVELLARIYRSKDQTLIRAIYHNLEAFAASVDVREKLDELQDDIDDLRNDNLELRATMQGLIKATEEKCRPDVRTNKNENNDNNGRA